LTPSSSLPQQTATPSISTAQVSDLPARMLLYWPSGAELWPSRLSPQHVALPAIVIAQV